MMQFIESVTTYSVGTAKARLIQAAASQFEHVIIEGDTMKDLIAHLKIIVDIANRSYRGNTLLFCHEPGYISVRYPASGSEKMIVAISYAPVLHHITSGAGIREEIKRRLQKEDPGFCTLYLTELAGKGGEA